MYALLLAAVLITAPPEVEAQTVDGRTLVGLFVSLDATSVTIQTVDGPISLEIEKLMALFPKEKPIPPADLHEDAVWVELVDGSSLVARQYTVSDDRARITLTDGQTIELPTAGVSTVRFQAESEQIAAAWLRILKMQVESDLLVVRKGETIDYHRGVLREVTDQVVRFELDGDVLPVKRAKVYGLSYFRPPVGELPESVCRITDASGSQWLVGSLALASAGDGTPPPEWAGDLQWTTLGGLTVTRPLAMVAQIDFSGGKVIFLSDLKPESVAFTPYFGRNRDVPTLAKFFAPREDKNLESGPLRLGKKEYRKGLALHSRTKVVYRLPGRFRRFQATVGIDDGVRPHGHVRLVISGDDKVLLETTVTGADPPQPVELDLTGVRRLAILADFGAQLDVADHLDLCEARILK